MTKQSSPELSSLAGRVLAGHWPNREETLMLAASVLAQDETPADPGVRAEGEKAVEKALDPDWHEPEAST